MHQLSETNSVKLPKQKDVIRQELADSKIMEQFQEEQEVQNVRFLCS